MISPHSVILLFRSLAFNKSSCVLENTNHQDCILQLSKSVDLPFTGNGIKMIKKDSNSNGCITVSLRVQSK